MSKIVCDHSAQSWFMDEKDRMHCDDCGTEIQQDSLDGYWYRVVRVDSAHIQPRNLIACPHCHRPRMTTTKGIKLKNVPYYCWIDYTNTDDPNRQAVCTPEDALEHCRRK